MSYDEYPRYVSAAERRANAARKIAQLRKSGRVIKPVEIVGRAIARSFWGKAWCDNLEGYSDYANRLPRGRTYARNGSILDLQIKAGEIDALVSGSRLYEVNVRIESLSSTRWRAIRGECAGQIDSLLELLSGKVSASVMEVVSRKGDGLFPTPGEIRLGCTCPDWAVMCKHVAAMLYGVGARLDHEPEMLFTLRGLDPAEMVEAAIEYGVSQRKPARGRVLPTDDVSSVFGVDIEFADEALVPATKPKQPRRKSMSKANAKAKAKAKTDAPRKPSPQVIGLPPSAVRLLTLITGEPGLRGPELAALLGVSRSTVASGVAKLKARGLIAFEGAPRNGGYFPSDVA